MKIEELLKKLASYESKIETKQYKDLNFMKVKINYNYYKVITE